MITWSQNLVTWSQPVAKAAEIVHVSAGQNTALSKIRVSHYGRRRPWLLVGKTISSPRSQPILPGQRHHRYPGRAAFTVSDVM